MRRDRPAPRAPHSTDDPGSGSGNGDGSGNPPGSGNGIGTEPPRRSPELRTMPGRLEWNAALARESARAARYHHPASIAIVELRHQDPKIDVSPFMRALAGPISRVLREDSRATDLVARVATARFQVLMPETTEAGAEGLAERLATRCRGYIERTGAPIAVRFSVAGTGLQDSLQDALAHALRSIEAA